MLGFYTEAMKHYKYQTMSIRQRGEFYDAYVRHCKEREEARESKLSVQEFLKQYEKEHA
jgi:hypothetical protein